MVQAVVIPVPALFRGLSFLTVLIESLPVPNTFVLKALRARPEAAALSEDAP